jgi:GGDEF domain-containing protein
MDANPRLLDRHRLRARLEEETERSVRYGHRFALLLFEALPASDGLPIRQKMALALPAVEEVVRGSDVIAQPYEDMLAVMLVETDAAGAHDALFRIRQRIADAAGAWKVTTLLFPEQADAIAGMSFLQAA